MKIVVIIPTYNEAENISKLIPVLEEEFKKYPSHEYYILVVDGNSPDGTGDVVKELSVVYPNTILLPEREKAGLGSAYIYGFKHAIDNMGADVVVEMDADFQHDPADFLKLIKKIDEGYDYVIGSRFSKGGSIPKEWAFHRKLQSVGGNIFSKFVLGIFDVNDFTSGFKASRVRGFVDKLVNEPILSKGFAYKIDLLYKMHNLGARIAEVPISFGIRDRGTSKMERNNAIDSLKVVISLRINRNKNFFKFVCVGFIGLFVDVGLANLFRLFIAQLNIAAVSSAGIAMLVTFILNNFWSFSEKKISSVSKLIVTFLPYVVLSIVPIAFRYFFVGYTSKNISSGFVVYNLSLFFCIVLGLVWNFTMYSKVIWRKK